MALLMMLNYGTYTNKNAVENVLRYILRIRKNETRAHELLAYGGMGVSLYAPPEMMIQEFRYVQNFFQIHSRNGRRMHHEVLNLWDFEYESLGRQIQILYSYALDCCREYYGRGHQVVFAIHWEEKKCLHIHFAINAVNYLTGRKWHSSLQETAERGRIFQKLLDAYRMEEGGMQCAGINQTVEECADKRKRAYYVVASGRNVGVFDNWPECEEQVLYYRGSSYKKVETLEKAAGYVYNHMMMSDGPYVVSIGGCREAYQDFGMFLDCLDGLAKMIG